MMQNSWPPQLLPLFPLCRPLKQDNCDVKKDEKLTPVQLKAHFNQNGPDAFDCSGLVVWAFHQAGLALPRSSQALASGGQPVELDQMQPGDVISFFPDASHVGIYLGDSRMIHAPFDGAPVAVEWLNDAPINNVRRYR